VITTQHATCSRCGRRVQIDRVDHAGRAYPVWHNPPVGQVDSDKRCPGTDQPMRGVGG
jgi:hypothetical protein